MGRPSNASKAAAAKVAQSQDALNLLRRKQPKAETVPVTIDDEGTVVEMTFRGVGRKRYNEILEAHQTEPEPVETPEGEEPVEQEPVFDFENFILQLVHESLVDPEGATLDDVHAWHDEWNGTEFDQLAGCAMRVNAASRVGELVKD